MEGEIINMQCFFLENPIYKNFYMISANHIRFQLSGMEIHTL